MQPMVITPFSKMWGYGAPVVFWFAIANVAIWLIMIITDGLGWFPISPEVDYYTHHSEVVPVTWYTLFAMTPELVMKGRVWQLITSMFLHDSQNMLHLVFNMFLLWMFGPRVERTFGSRTFLLFYLAAGLGGGLLSLAMRLLVHDSMIPSLGASGAVFGVLVGYAFLYGNEIAYLFFVVPVRVWKAVVGFIVVETLFVLFRLVDNVDHWGHLGGAFVAAVWMLTMIRSHGHKTSHGWHSAEQKVFGRTSGKKGFRIVFRRPDKPDFEHPEGTDNDPPPEWFKM
jgi:membrane associated rhomboid family serine protease